MLHIAICDDDAAELAQTRALLDEFLASRALAARVREFAAGKELLFDLEDSGAYDLYLLDVVMPEMNGIELGVKLRETDEHGAIIYLTTSEDFAIDSYSARAFWYLVKPVAPDKLFPVLDKAVAALQKRLDEGIAVKTRDGIEPLLADRRFRRCGASLVLNLHFVKTVDKSGATLRTGERLELPRRAAADLRDAWAQYWLKGDRKL